ncbi:putative lipid II flippase FtsW [Flagellatimonas centrodinii]|uniref:putative lipid II flippase FtsW n=1 Tax=Flagellatimonas centrodinii TaxID=2806210 RepID=UPI001FEDF280|nr:putative lipid II flippase FtsW [Flagellatimonas centrodinii]ULQ47103.1 putative lipid II flippase FtsW [Flagellatimonas centrodinii]
MTDLAMPLQLPRTRYGIDGALVLAAVTLMVWGLIMVASASVAHAEKVYDDPFHFFWRQLIFIGLGGAVGFALYCLPVRVWEQSSWLLFGLALLLLTLVLIPGIGVEVNYSRRWLDLPFIRVQASEPARLALILYLAGYIVRRQVEVQHSFKGLAKPVLLLVIPAVLLLAEPDFGATAILFAVAFLMLFMGGAPVTYYLGLITIAAVGLAGVAMMESYRMRRILSFTNPWADVENGGWQLAQSLIAVGRGEWAGVGLGNSVQKLLYLPEMHTDFIFAILAEEFGLIGVTALLALFAVVVWRGFAIARAAEQRDARFAAYLCYGLTGWIGLQALINLSVNMGLLPTKGLTLPLLSYGGSSLITVLAMLGLILRVDYENRASAKERVR